MAWSAIAFPLFVRTIKVKFPTWAEAFKIHQINNLKIMSP